MLDNGNEERVGIESRRTAPRQITVSITCVLESIKSLRMKRYGRGIVDHPYLLKTKLNERKLTFINVIFLVRNGKIRTIGTRVG